MNETDKQAIHFSGAFGEVVEEDDIDGSGMIADKVRQIAEEIRLRGGIR